MQDHDENRTTGDGEAARTTGEGEASRTTGNGEWNRITGEGESNRTTGKCEPNRPKGGGGPDRTRWTILELQRLSSDEWRAMQAGTEHVGRGPTAAAAAAAYCRRVDDHLRDVEGDESDGDESDGGESDGDGTDADRQRYTSEADRRGDAPSA